MKGKLLTGALAVVSSLAFLGCGGAQSRSIFTSNSAPTTSATATTSIPISGSNAALQQYHWKPEGLTFSHPASWTTEYPLWTSIEKAQPLKTKPEDQAASIYSSNVLTETGFRPGDDASKAATFIGTFAAMAERNEADVITAASQAANGTFISKVTPLTVPGHKQLYIIEEGDNDTSHVDKIAITDTDAKVGPTHSADADSFQSKADPTWRVSITIGFYSYEKGDDLRTYDVLNMTAPQFDQSPEYATAMNILKSVNYAAS